VKREDGEADAV